MDLWSWLSGTLIHIDSENDFCDTFPLIGNDTFGTGQEFIGVVTFVLKDLIDVRFYCYLRAPQNFYISSVGFYEILDKLHVLQT